MYNTFGIADSTISSAFLRCSAMAASSARRDPMTKDVNSAASW